MKKVLLIILLSLIVLSTAFGAYSMNQEEIFVSPASGGDTGGRAILDSIFFLI